MSFEFAAMSESDEAALATAQNQRATALTALVTAQIINPDEARKYLRDSPDSGFDFLDPTEPEDMGSMMDDPDVPTERIDEVNVDV